VCAVGGKTDKPEETAAALRVMGFRDEGFERQRTEKGTRLWGGASLPCGFPPVEQLTD